MEHVATEAPAVRWVKYMGGPEAVLEVVRGAHSVEGSEAALALVIVHATDEIDRTNPPANAGRMVRLETARVRALATLRELVTT